jgi:hypothetical protein
VPHAYTIHQSILSKKTKKTSKREILLATLTLISTLLTVIGTANSVYSGWLATKEKEENVAKSQAEDLQAQIEYARQLLPRCNLAPAEQTEINSTLTKDFNELKLNGDTQAAKSLFDSVRNRLVDCPMPVPVSSSLIVVASAFPILLALVSLFFAIAWRSERRRSKAVSARGTSEPEK